MMDLRYNFRHQRIYLSNPGVSFANRLSNRCLSRSSIRPSASDSRDGKSYPTKQVRQSNSKLNKLIPALLKERKGFGVLVTVTLTTVSRVAKQYLSTLLEQAEENAKEQTRTAQNETSQTSNPRQIQTTETTDKATNEEKDEYLGPRSVSIEDEPSSCMQVSEGNRDSSQAGNMGQTDQPDATSSENEGASDLQIDRDVKKAMLNGRHISLLTSPFSAEEAQRMGSGFSGKKQGTRIPQQIVQSSSRKGKQTKSMSMKEFMGGGSIGDGGDNDGGGGGGGDGNSNGSGGGDDNDSRSFFTLIVITALIALFGFAAKRLDFSSSHESIDQINESK